MTRRLKNHSFYLSLKKKREFWMMIDVDPEHVPCSYDTITVQQPLAAAVLLLVVVGIG